MSASLVIGIVDDDPGVRGSIESLVRSAGMIPHCFSSAGELLTTDGAGLACVVTDLHMPEMSGLALQAEMLRRGWTIPLILMTAFPTDAAREQAMRAGARAFLTKPVDPDALLDAIEAGIG
ncbi:response regulator transcription factor [Sphingomonas sp. M1-B02]|uniref:response regulator transcription factor n=1 Tax=Sphingomonas sp. M1-B02 TaxID=3114300 RepID=UPI00224067AD|nr:response regulator [Sphingomonas sp. S6-11]UZK66993.1 response regulator [Sphingomonas sp. S6-11]